MKVGRWTSVSSTGPHWIVHDICVTWKCNGIARASEVCAMCDCRWQLMTHLCVVSKSRLSYDDAPIVSLGSGGPQQ